MEPRADKSKALEAALSQIDRAFGKGSVMRLGQRESAVDAGHYIEGERLGRPLR